MEETFNLFGAEGNLLELLTRKEPLNPELKKYLTSMGGGMKALRHPLVYSVPYSEQSNALLNKSFIEKSKYLKELREGGNYSSYIFLHERPYRLQAFLDISHLLNDKTYWKLLREIWTGSENIWQNKEDWNVLLNVKRKWKHFFMEASDRKFFKELPETFTVYRGYNVKHKNKDGYSYTLDESKAIWFSKRYCKGNDGRVIKRTVNKKDVFAYNNSRNEQEIIILNS